MDSDMRPQRISCQYEYIRTIPGILKTIEFVNKHLVFFLAKHKNVFMDFSFVISSL